MKKNILKISIGLIFASLLLGSCRKDHDCNCVVNEEKTVVTYNQETKKNAQKACDERLKAAKLVDPSAKCEIVD